MKRNKTELAMAFLVNSFSWGRSMNNLVTKRHSFIRSCFVQNLRTRSAAAGDDNNYYTQIRRASDYDDDFFAAVAPKETSIPKPAGYGFFDSSDHVFDQTQETYDSAVESTDDDVASFRARYQRPLSSKTREEMPPPITYNDDDEQMYETNYNWFEDTKPQTQNRVIYSEDEIEGGKIGKSTARIIQPNELQNPIPGSQEADSIEGVKTVRTSAKILRPGVSASRVEPKLVKSSARIIPIGSDQDDSLVDPPFQQPLAKPVYTPSFMEPDRSKVITNNSDQVDGERLIPNMAKASLGSSSISYATTLQNQIEHLRAQIFQMNKGEEFNIDSPKQVSRILFGEEGKSTNKDALEVLASTGNQMAACIYKYRKVSKEYKRELKKMEQLNKGDKKNDYYGNLTRQRNAGETNLATQTTHDNEHVNPRREPLLLIDTSAYIFRSYHAIPPLHHSDGTPTGALHGVCRMLQNLLLTRLLKGDRPRVVLAFDSKGDNFRHKLYPEYKANRGPCPEDLIPQFDLVKEAADAFGIVQVEAQGYEADDVIATLAKRAVEEGVDVDILSGDKDLMQLISPS